MSVRDEFDEIHSKLLADAKLQPEYAHGDSIGLYGYSEGAEHALDTVRALGYRKLRTIATAEEVSDMAIDSIVRTHGGVPLELWESEDEEREWRVTGHRPWTDAELTKNLPATVLYEPEAQP